ncbi:MAG TPA: tRNA-dihydrouridine synthase family protein [Gammaproteobacteria bacterium]|nr:tRNA-dihydrouridine synthase family protein [Gammaproteobacteria bacterium]
MLKPLQIADKVLPINIIQGPLAGVSSAPFRVLMSKYMPPAYACTEMISAKTLIQQSAAARQRFVAKDLREGQVCFQLSGNDPSELGKATRIATDLGADIIDLNCGCPVKKIRQKGAGSRLLTESDKLYKLITAMKQNTHVPVSIKRRVESSSEKFNEEIAKIVTEAGLDFLVVHGRHWTEHYETPCRYDDIEFFVQRLKIPVIGNGDISCLNTLNKMFDTGCAGVMIARAGVGQPWLVQKLVAEYQGESFTMPSLPERGSLFIEHVAGLVVLLQSEKFALLHARKLARYYARGMTGKMEFCDKVNACQNMCELSSLSARYFCHNS